ncbi:Dynamitin-domain-containing protein [Endogone sp. FLAS-F59071]|nr:Dynamitin-domain-containing protein [Endogone sp. FLAS-F59071]|eukprot:RUS18170.1 Dynamitin-domain-containing protein [Endogone sp. FLAS-F59071]
MSTKYTRLPDIDTQPDVYETLDNPEEAHVLSLEDQGHLSEGDSQDVDRAHISIKDATRIFKDSSVDAKDADFSDRLTKRKKAMYRTFVKRPTTLETSEYEVLPKELALEETHLQKLRRLMFEVQELNDEIEKAKEPSTTLPPVSHSELLATISSLQTDLTRISQNLGETSSPVDPTDGTPMRQHEEAKTLIRQLEAYKSGAVAADGEEASKGSEGTLATVGDGRTVTYELYYTPDAAKITTLAKAAEMDERIAKVEKLVGSSSSQNFGELPPILLSTTLTTAVEKLEQQLKILTQRGQLDVLGRRVKSLINDLDRLNDLRNRDHSAVLSASMGSGGAGDLTAGISEESEKKISRLFTLLENIDPLLTVTPALLARLRGLQQLHTEAATFSESIKMLSEEQGKILEEVKGLNGVCEKLEVSFKENDDLVKNNIKIVDDRITDLVQQIAKLNGQ